MLKQVNKHFEVFYHTNKSIIDGELVPDIFETKKFQVFTEAVKFAQSIDCAVLGACSISQQDVYLNGSIEVVRPSGDTWEVERDSCILL